MAGSESAESSRLKSTVRGALRRAGFDIVRSRNNRGGVADFIPFEPTMRAARAAGLSVGDYIDTVMSRTPGATESTINSLRELGVFADDPAVVLEIGPGSGRYLEKTLHACSPGRYEIYETAAPWSDYLVETYKVVAQPTEGCSLASTPDGSVDLVLAHKVFNTVTFLCATRYFLEMARVTRPGGRIVFDVMTETTLDPPTVRAWAAKGGTGHDSYPAAMPRGVCVELFATLGFTLENSFLAPMAFASTEVLVFKKHT